MKICWEVHVLPKMNEKSKTEEYKKDIELIDYLEYGYGSIFVHTKDDSIEEGQIYCAHKIWFEK